MTKRCYFDTETRSRTDITRGLDLYTRDAECLIVTYALDDGPVKIWEPWRRDSIPSDLWAATRHPGTTFVALNAVFDWLIFQRCLHLTIPIERLWCVMAQANAHGLPGSLADLGDACALPPHLKKLTGSDYHLIDTFCIPQPRTGKFIEPTEKLDEWKRFCEYAVRDTESLRAIAERLPKTNFDGVNLASWRLDQLINCRGFGFDIPLARDACKLLAAAKSESNAIVQSITDGEVRAATQRDKLLSYLWYKANLDIKNLTAGAVTEQLERDDLEPTIRTLLEQRLDAGKSAGSKFLTGLDRVGPGGRIRHWSRWSGAGRTGRHSGRGFQPHNMLRPAIRVRREDGATALEPVKASYIDEVILPGVHSGAALSNDLVYGTPHEAAGLAVRHTIVAAPGNELIAGDFKNIESVITPWLAGDTLTLAVYAESFANPKDKSKDVYRILAGKMLGKAPAEVTDVERQMGKVCILAFSFGGGVSALVNMALTYQMDLDTVAGVVLPTATPPQLAKAYAAWRRAFLTGEDFELECRTYMACDVLKQQFRTANAAVSSMRHDIDDATKGALQDRGHVYHVACCMIWATSSMLIVELPSKRRLLYMSPELKTESIEDPDGGSAWKSSYITYATYRGKSWRREKAWSGLFVENIVQATANDVLRAAMLRIHADTQSVPALRNYMLTLPSEERTCITLHVHDEAVLEVPKGSYPVERFREVLTTKESWFTDLPIAADVWVNERYGKR